MELICENSFLCWKCPNVTVKTPQWRHLSKISTLIWRCFHWLCLSIYLLLVVREPITYTERGVSRTLWSIKDGDFYENSQPLPPVNYFHKKLHLRCLIGSWIRLLHKFNCRNTDTVCVSCYTPWSLWNGFPFIFNRKTFIKLIRAPLLAPLNLISVINEFLLSKLSFLFHFTLAWDTGFSIRR